MLDLVRVRRRRGGAWGLGKAEDGGMDDGGERERERTGTADLDKYNCLLIRSRDV